MRDLRSRSIASTGKRKSYLALRFTAILSTAEQRTRCRNCGNDASHAERCGVQRLPRGSCLNRKSDAMVFEFRPIADVRGGHGDAVERRQQAEQAWQLWHADFH